MIEKSKKNNLAKPKYKSKFNPDWCRLFFWVKPIIGDQHSARCFLCPKTFSIAETGIQNVKRHGQSKEHQSKEAQHCGETSQQLLVANDQQMVEVSRSKY